MIQNEFIPVGHCLKPHKLDGGMKITFHHFLLADPEIIKTLFIGSETKPLPYFVERLKHTADSIYLVKLEDINSPEEAAKLKKQAICVTLEQFKEWFDQPDEDYIAPSGFIGFSLLDQNNHTIGTIDDVYQMNMQDLAVLHIDGSEVLIPLADGNILEIDLALKQVKVEIPEGLLDLYL